MNATTDLRRTFIGGSDIGAILGVSRFRTAMDVWLEKTGQATQEVDPQREKVFRRGKRLEPVVLEMLAEEKGIVSIARNERYVDASHPFLSCEVDAEAIIDGEHCNLEVKTSHPFAADQWGDEGTDEIDISYTAQAMWGLGITKRRRCIFAVLIGSDNLVTYEVKQDDETFALMHARAIEFWERNVLAGVPPDPVNLPDVLKILRKAPTSKAEASVEIIEACAELERVKQAKAAAEDREVELKFQIGRFVVGETGILLGNGGKLTAGPEVKPGNHVITLAGAPLFNVTLQNQTRIDTEQLRKLHPEIATACSKSSSFFKFEKPRTKGKRK